MSASVGGPVQRVGDRPPHGGGSPTPIIEAYLTKMTGQARMRRPIVVTDDRADAENQGSRVLSEHRLRAGADFEARFYDAPLDTATLLGASYNGRPTVVGTEPTGHWNVSMILHGALQVKDDRNVARAEAGWLLITPPTTNLCVEFAPTTAFIGVRIPAALLERRLSLINGGAPAGPLDLARVVAPGPAASAVVALLRQAITAADGPLLPVALRLAIEEALLTTVLMSVPGSHTEELFTPPEPVATQRVHRAAELMRPDGTPGLSLREIAETVGLSLRRLQAGFQATYGTTPTRFQRDLRLDDAHRALQAAERGHSTVADVATAAGFSHLGRFSVDYRRRFGVAPSETLRD